MYRGIKSCVSHNGEQSSFFSSFRGVRQGENLSPLLFALFSNDLETFLSDKSCGDVNIEFKYDDIALYLKLFVLLYADDTVIFWNRWIGISKEFRYVLWILRIMALKY